MSSSREVGRIPLVLLPGTLCDTDLWQQQIRNLADLATPWPGDITRDESIPAMATRTLAAAPGRFALAGLSMGAIVALEIMRRAPERVMALALLDTNPGAADGEQLMRWEEEIAIVENGGFAKLVDDRWIPSMLRARGTRRSVLRQIIRRMAFRIGPESYVRQLRAQMHRADSRPSLPAITCPTLVLGGRQDTLCSPALHRAMAAAIPHAQLEIIADCGHLSTLEQPEAVTTALRGWLEKGLCFESGPHWGYWGEIAEARRNR